MAIRLDGLDHVALTVTDVDASAAWYRDVLGLERRYEEEWGATPAMMVASGAETGVALFLAGAAEPGSPPSSRPRDLAMWHVAFRLDRSGFVQAQAELGRLGIEFEFQDHIASHSIYFSDPDGHQLEITTYELD